MQQRSTIASLAFGAALLLAAPGHAGEIKPYQAQPIEPYRSKSIEPYQAQPVQPNAVDRDARRGRPAATVAPFETLFGTWSTFVPGAAYQTPSSVPGYDKFHVSPGAAASALTISPDGRYVWGDLRGTWQRTGNADYPIVLRRAKDERDWKVGAEIVGGGPELTIWDGFTWYKGRRSGG